MWQHGGAKLISLQNSTVQWLWHTLTARDSNLSLSSFCSILAPVFWTASRLIMELLKQVATTAELSGDVHFHQTCSATFILRLIMAHSSSTLYGSYKKKKKSSIHRDKVLDTIVIHLVYKYNISCPEWREQNNVTSTLHFILPPLSLSLPSASHYPNTFS